MKKSISQNGYDVNEKNGSVTEEFTGKRLTRFGGVGLIRRFFEKHWIKEKIEEGVEIEGRRESKYSVGTMLISVLYGIFFGYPRPGQMKVLWKDRVFQKGARLKGFPVQSTLSRFFGALRVSVAFKIARINFKGLMAFRKGFREFLQMTLDLDSHVTSVYGKQQRAGLGHNPKKKGRKSYNPLFCFIGETRDYLGGLFRSGKHHTSYHAIAFLKAMLKKLPSHLEKIRLRADSGFFSVEMLKFLISRSIEFYIVVPLQPWVQKMIRSVRNWRSIGRGVEVGEWEYPLMKGVVLRMVVVRKRVKVGASPRKQLKLLNLEDVRYDYQVIVTSSQEVPEEVWRFYNQRACCENFIKEGIYGFGLDEVISHTYAGNYAYFELLMWGYNLMNFFKEEVLNQRKVKEMIQTIRDRIFHIPGKLVYLGRRWVLRLERSWHARVEYEEALARVT